MIVSAWVLRKLKAQEQQRQQAAQQEGRKAGRRELQAQWEAWNQRRIVAEAAGTPFTEPPPTAETSSDQ